MYISAKNPEITIVTHRGLESSIVDFFSESSYEAFKNQLERDYGIEFDFNVTADNQIVILHDMNLKRITVGRDERTIKSLPAAELRQVPLKKGRICFFADLAPLLLKSKANHHAFHIKAPHQTPENLRLIADSIAAFPQLEETFLLFDVSVDSAKLLHQLNPRLKLAPSVAHSYDIERYNSAVGGTLLSISQALENRGLFSGVWLDEWDLTDENGGTKQFYTAEVFKIFRDAGLLIGLVTPELHGTSPGLLGGEAHQDSMSFNTLFKRMAKIIDLRPDIVCTDYPSSVRELVEKAK